MCMKSRVPIIKYLRLNKGGGKLLFRLSYWGLLLLCLIMKYFHVSIVADAHVFNILLFVCSADPR